MEMICPIMAKGWLQNKYAAHRSPKDTFGKDNLPKCYEHECACWNKADEQCGLATRNGK